MGGWTKQQLIVKAFSKIGLGRSVLDLSPEQLQEGLNELDGMLATWDGLGIHLGYPLPSSPDKSDLSQNSGIPDRAIEAVFSNLALRLADSVGRSISPVLLTLAKQSYSALLSGATQPPEKRLSRMPAGAGYKEGRYRPNRVFIDDCDRSIAVGDDSELDVE